MRGVREWPLCLLNEPWSQAQDDDLLTFEHSTSSCSTLIHFQPQRIAVEVEVPACISQAIHESEFGNGELAGADVRSDWPEDSIDRFLMSLKVQKNNISILLLNHTCICKSTFKYIYFILLNNIGDRHQGKH